MDPTFLCRWCGCVDVPEVTQASPARPGVTDCFCGGLSRRPDCYGTGTGTLHPPTMTGDEAMLNGVLPLLVFPFMVPEITVR